MDLQLPFISIKDLLVYYFLINCTSVKHWKIVKNAAYNFSDPKSSVCLFISNQQSKTPGVFNLQ